MPSHPRNMSEQEYSIKARAQELFDEPPGSEAVPKATKPFPMYLRETPPQPLSPFTKTVFWIVGVIVAGLFLMALWRITHRHRSRPEARPSRTMTAMVLHSSRSGTTFPRPGELASLP
jgi:hypothetical protein